VEGYDQGVFTCADPALASRFLLGVLNWTITWYRPEGSLTPAEIAEQFANLFLQGILVAQGQAMEVELAPHASSPPV